MLCTIDIGNTLKKYAVWDEEVLCQQGVWDNEIPEQVLACNRWVVSNVSGQELAIPAHVNALIVNYTVNLPYTLKYKTPETLGIDRLASVAGAIQMGFSRAIVIDCGTCIKIELLINDEYIGGSISPGIYMRGKAMHEYTNKLPLVEPKAYLANYGQSTTDSLLCCMTQGAASEIDGRISNIFREFGECPVLITGGDAILLHNHLKHKIFASPNLLHLGLFKINTLND